MNIGDRVVIVRSPYNCLKNGTEATITDVKFVKFGTNATLYLLDTYPCRSFRKWEIRKIENEKE